MKSKSHAWLQGNFQQDKRLLALQERLALYYKQTPDDMSNSKALKYRLQFSKWCRDCGYTPQEIKRAKSQVEV